MLWALSDGREVAASELARVAGVTRPTASVHLAKLSAANLVSVRSEGRYRHYRLARPELVQALEALAILAPPASPRTHRQARIGRAVRAARTCYDHLAGRLGVGLTHALVERGALRAAGRQFDVTPGGARLLGGFGVEGEAGRRGRLLRAPSLCWGQRVPRLAGALGAALLARLLALGWIERSPASRAVSVT